MDASGGALLLVRDVSELRQTERALLTKDATIREVHHRVKNNLQTVAALLRLQARRMPSDETRHALLDAVARVTTIAFVHETLSHEAGDEVDFDTVTAKLLDLARDTAASVGALRGSVMQSPLTRSGQFSVFQISWPSWVWQLVHHRPRVS